MLPVPALPVGVASRDIRRRPGVSLRSFPVESVPVQDGDRLNCKINCLELCICLYSGVCRCFCLSSARGKDKTRTCKLFLAGISAGLFP